MPFLAVRDIEIWAERAGSGPRLLAISGTGGDLRRKPGLLDSPFADTFEVLAYDQRGLGRSSKPDRAYSMADYADDAAGLLDAVGWTSAAVVGVSFGGMVAQELAIRHPGRVDRLALCCTSPGGAGGASYPLHTLAHLTPAERARRMLAISDTRQDAAWLAAHPAEAEQMIQLAVADPFADEPGHAVGAGRQIEARAAHDVWDRLDRIRCPTLVCGGRHDGLALPAALKATSERIAGAELRLFEGGHLFLWQDPAAFPEVAAFLAPRR